MVFSSITFLYYFLPAFLAVYYLLPHRFKNLWIVFASLLFYSWGAPVFILTVVVSCLIDYGSALQFSKPIRRLMLFIAVGFNIAMLGYFKYADFFIENFNHIFTVLTGRAIPLAHIILPVGISFITFQKISYLADVYRGDCKPQRNFLHYLLFVILFPQLIAGPIVRYKDISDQITGRFHQITRSNAFSGLVQFIIGLSKKVLIANVLGEYADSIFNSGSLSELSFTKASTGMLAYTMQIYFDFSGYSDMAIGLGRMMGFTFPENFNFPYSSSSITEFWKRWHMTLGSWMKDYLYIPLGGNRSNHTYRNLMIVFLFSGLWHGASWNFVLWGVFHGFFLVMERAWLGKVLKQINPLISTIYTFIAVMLGWILFRTETLTDAMQFYGLLFNPNQWGFNELSQINPKVITVGIIAICFSMIPMSLQKYPVLFFYPERQGTGFIMAAGLIALILYVFCIAELFATGFNPFIYFRF